MLSASSQNVFDIFVRNKFEPSTPRRNQICSFTNKIKILSEFKQILSYFFEAVMGWRLSPSSLTENNSEMAKIEPEFVFKVNEGIKNNDGWITVYLDEGTRTSSRL